MPEKDLSPAPLSLTEAARTEISKIKAGQTIPSDHFLRVGMHGSGCGGMSYLLGFDTQKENDIIYSIDGYEILVDQRHSMYVLGMEIDFHEDKDQAGFVFNNPRERKTD